MVCQKFSLYEENLKFKLVMKAKNTSTSNFSKISMRKIKSKDKENSVSQIQSSTEAIQDLQMPSGINGQQQKLLRIMQPVIEQSLTILRKVKASDVFDVKPTLKMVSLITSVMRGFKENKTIGQIQELARTGGKSMDKTEGLISLLKVTLDTKF